MPLLNLRDVTLGFGGKPLFAGVDLSLEKGERLCLVGVNGAGKTTLLKVMAGMLEPDSGERSLMVGAKVGFLPQSPDFGKYKTVRDYVASGLGEAEALEAPHLIEDMLSRFDLEGDADPHNFSGGEKKRVDLAKVLIGSPDILFLDEPTNHLDLPAIELLEETLVAYRGAIVVVSHDRTFLSNLTNCIGWLQGGKIWRHDKGFSSFEEWSENIENQWERETERMQNHLRQEMHWLHRGVTARRKRNMGRLKRLQVLRKETAERKRKASSLRLAVDEGNRSGALVVEVENIAKSYGEETLVKDFSARIMRGERIGIIGANGSGKTTLIKMLTGQLDPDSGSIRLGENLKIAFFDQHRAELNPEWSIKQVLCPTGGDYVEAPDGRKHVASYLKDFLFAPERMGSPVKSLSGGEKNRLLLARKLSEPCNLMVMDEPTNDLDIETLDLLQELLADYAGTLIIVSHDRDFLDKTVTSILAFEDGGKITEYAGGYSDYVTQRPQAREAALVKAKPKAVNAAPKDAAPRNREKTKLSYNEQRDWEELPKKIEKLAKEIADLENKIADSNFYEKSPAEFSKCVTTLEAKKAEQETAETRWLELELLKEELGK